MKNQTAPPAPEGGERPMRRRTGDAPRQHAVRDETQQDRRAKTAAVSKRPPPTNRAPSSPSGRPRLSRGAKRPSRRGASPRRWRAAGALFLGATPTSHGSREGRVAVNGAACSRAPALFNGATRRCNNRGTARRWPSASARGCFCFISRPASSPAPGIPEERGDGFVISATYHPELPCTLGQGWTTRNQ